MNLFFIISTLFRNGSLHTTPLSWLTNYIYLKEGMFMPKIHSTDIAVAHFRFALIAPVVQGTFYEASASAYYRKVTEKPLTLPDGTTFKYNPKTLEKWTQYYRKDGMDALMPKSRCDKGSSRTLNDAAIEEIFRIKVDFPKLNATQIYFRLVEEGFIPASVSVASVQRFIKKHDLKSARNPNIKDRKAFEEPYFGALWQADYSDDLVIPTFT
jgi:hypothetical protein